MKMKNNMLVLGIAIFSFVACIMSLFVLPDTIPIHWNALGEIDNYGSKYFVLLFGGLGIGVYYLMNFTKKIDPLEEKINEKIETYCLMRDLMTLMMSSMSIIFLLAIFIPNFNLASTLNVILGFAFVVMGNYMPRVPHNYFLGAKTPWALENESNWKKTQRMCGYVFCIGGLMMLLGGIINKSWAMSASVFILCVSSIFVYVYSWLLYKGDHQ